MAFGLMAEPCVRVGVTVTFLRMDHPPRDPAPVFPPGVHVAGLPNCTVAQYRALYNGVGEAHVWWLRRALSDADLARHLRNPRVGVNVLHADMQAAGFYELDWSSLPSVNISYFGLLPHAIGRGLGRALLRHAIDAAWRHGARAVTVNTCTADHPQALPNYRQAGFTPVREVREEWHVPTRLGLTIPAHLLLD